MTAPFVRRDHSGCRQPTDPGCYEHPLTAPDLSAAEAAKVAEFEAAPDTEESLRRRLALAFAAADNDLADWWTLADAAIAVMRGTDA